MSEDPNFPGLWVPVNILLSEALNSHEVLLIGAIGALQANSRGCFASNDYLSKVVHLAKSTISGHLKALEEKGWIHILRGRNPDGVEERQMVLSLDAENLYRGRSPLRAAAPDPEAPPSAGRTR